MSFLSEHLRRHCDEVLTLVNATGDPYLRRYYLVRNEWFKIYVHHILRSDEDEELHDHPWDFVSFLLWGYYLEWLPSKAIFWPQFSIIRHKAEDAHRLELQEPAWTLVFVGKKRRDWGFFTADGWLPHWDFFKLKFGGCTAQTSEMRKFMGDEDE